MGQPIHRIEIRPRVGIDDPKGSAAAKRGRQFLQIAVSDVRTHTVYKLDLDLDSGDAGAVCQAITDPVLDPVRRVIPPIGMVDISPIVVFIGLQILQRVLVSMAAGV